MHTVIRFWVIIAGIHGTNAPGRNISYKEGGMDVKEFFEAAVKGCVIGGTMLVPGFSGGSMAMILGVYDRLIRAAAGIGHAGRKQLAFMIAFARKEEVSR